MVHEEMFAPELEWISGKTRILIRPRKVGSSRCLDIHLDTDYPNAKPRVTLLLDLYAGRVRVTDLRSNGFQSGLQNGGYGTLAVNIALQSLRRYYCLDPGVPDSTHNPTLSGSVSSTGDPDEEPHRSECWQRRNHFWSRFGFKLNDPSVSDTGMQASLADLHEIVSGTTANGTPRWVSIELFWPRDKRPLLLPGAKETLASIEPSLLELHDCPSADEIRVQRRKAVSLAYWAGRSAALAGITLTLLILSKLTSLNTIIGVGIFGAFSSYLVKDCVAAHLFTRLPRFHICETLEQRRRSAIQQVCHHITQIEESRNGLFWRLFEAMVVLQPLLKNEAAFVELADWSKRGTIGLYVDRPPRFDEYRCFISAARRWVVEQADQLEKPLSTFTGDKPLDNALQPAEIDAVDY